MRPLRAAVVAIALPLLLASTPPPTSPDPETVVLDAIAKSTDITGQAAILARLAWPDQEQDPRVSVSARQKLVFFGRPGFPALRAAVTGVKPKYQADAVRALIEANRNLTYGSAPEYAPALDDVLWFGTREAKAVALPELGRIGAASSLLAMIDSAIEAPELLSPCVEALGQIGDERARFFLDRVLNEGEPGVRESAAVALSRIGGQAHAPLRNAMRSKNQDLRLLAVRALLPTANLEDLTALHEYAASFPGDDAGTYKAAQDAAVALDKLLEAQQAAEAASPPPE